MRKEYDEVVLLHNEIYMPDWVTRKARFIQSIVKKNYFLSNHFRIDHSKVNRDYKHNVDGEVLIEKVKELENNQIDPFEVELSRQNDSSTWDVTKYVVRLPLDDKVDVAIVVRFNKIITAWLNEKEDTHLTLQYDKYNSTL